MLEGYLNAQVSRGSTLQRTLECRLSTVADSAARPIKRPMETREAARRTFSGPALRRSLVVALVVGTALNLINQGPELLSGEWPVLWKLALTYVVPFLVASYGSYAAFKSTR